MIRMVGPRYNQGRHEIKLTASRFTNRVENKRYLVYLLEQLVAEAKELSLQPNIFNEDFENKNIEDKNEII
jgi:hypothetical protein